MEGEPSLLSVNSVDPISAISACVISSFLSKFFSKSRIPRVSIIVTECQLRIEHRFLLKHHLPNSFADRIHIRTFPPLLSRTLRTVHPTVPRLVPSSPSPPFLGPALLSFRGMRTRDALLQIQMGTYANGATCYYTFPYTNNVLIGPRTSWLSVYAPWKPIYRSFCAHSFFSFFLLVFFPSFFVEHLSCVCVYMYVSRINWNTHEDPCPYPFTRRILTGRTTIPTVLHLISLLVLFFFPSSSQDGVWSFLIQDWAIGRLFLGEFKMENVKLIFR